MKREEIQQKALEKLNSYGHFCRAGVAISMGVGKTYIGLQHLDQKIKNVKGPISTKALIAAPKLSIINTWIEECKKFNLEYLLDHITFTTYKSLSKQNLDYDILYLDECHNLTINHKIWLDQHMGSIIGLTGTPPKKDTSIKGKLVNKFCPMIFEYFVDDAVQDNILNDYKIIVHMLDLESVKNVKVTFGERSWFTSEKESYQYWSNRYANANTPKQKSIVAVQRMKAMQKFPSKDRYAKKLLDQSENKCILFANEQKQADKLCEHSYHSNNPESDNNMILFKEGKITKLSCVLQLSEGANIPNLKEGIIMHAYGNNRKSAQRIGRLLRLNPDDQATVQILCYKNTVDEKWVAQALEEFDSSKIKYYDTEEF